MDTRVVLAAADQSQMFEGEGSNFLSSSVCKHMRASARLKGILEGRRERVMKKRHREIVCVY